MRLALLPLLWAPLALALSPPANYINTAVARTIELVGSTTQITTQYNIKSTSNTPGEYYLALAGVGEDEPAWYEVTVGGQEVIGKIVKAEAPTVAIDLGDIKKDGSVTLSLTYVLIHASTPLPASIEQKDAQYLIWKTNSTYVDSWYPSDVERIKIRQVTPPLSSSMSLIDRSPSPKILSTGTVPKTYTRDSDLTKASSTVTLGPFHSLPPTLGPKGVEQSPFHIHYETTVPIMGYRSLKRSAEVSHWGNNLNIQDEIDLVNMGPKLKGHFSRLAHQQSKFHASSPAQVFTDLTLRLPPTAHTTYYYDTIGNVSTSRFRPGQTPATQAKSKSRTAARVVDSQLELKPRYPILGGWNYSFVIGYDVPLSDMLKTDGGRKVLSVPFLTGYKDLAAEEVELKIVLPEGARDIEVHTPFPVDSTTHSIHKTYLDTTGRHTITLTKSKCTEHHAQPVYVTYTYPLSAHFQKPLAIASVVGGLFLLVMVLRRMDWSLDPKKIK